MIRIAQSDSPVIEIDPVKLPPMGEEDMFFDIKVDYNKGYSDKDFWKRWGAKFQSNVLAAFGIKKEKKPVVAEENTTQTVDNELNSGKKDD